MPSEPFRVALAQYPISRPARMEDYASNLRAWVKEAAGEGARLLVFPEYGAMELASLFGPGVEGDLARQIAEVAGLEAQVDGIHSGLAQEFGVHILAASMPARSGEGHVNRARLFGPGGGSGHHDKAVMTRFESEEWSVSPGGPLRVFDTPLGSIGVCICYDIEFPLIARALCEAGAELLLAPSCTDTAAGYHRVRTGALARALENQCQVAVAPTVGLAPWLPSVDVNTGAAGLYGPSDAGFPPTGVIVEGRLDKSGWVYADVDPARVRKARAQGQVFNNRDWQGQPGAGALALPAPERIRVD